MVLFAGVAGFANTMRCIILIVVGCVVKDARVQLVIEVVVECGYYYYCSQWLSQQECGVKVRKWWQVN